MKKKAILLIYGEGGHKSQMERLYNLLVENNKKGNIIFIGICENNKCIEELEKNFSVEPLRDKYENYMSFLLKFPIRIKNYIKVIKTILKNYEIIGVISTGPGIAIPFSLFFKILGKKIIFIETWSRFNTASFTGKIMYKIADKFYIQNKELKQFYPKAIYGGLL